jgi:acetyl-CoA acetyltransferase
MEGISREAVDALGLESQKRAAAAIAENRFAKSLVTVFNEDGSVALDHEEFPRPQTTAEGLAALEASFSKLADVPLDERGTTFRKLINQKYPDLKIEHVHHAGNSSGVVDGAAAVLVTSKAYADKHGLKPRARIVAMTNMGDCPTLMLNAPVPAARKVLAKAGLTVDDIDLWEINEAFAVVAEKFEERPDGSAAVHAQILVERDSQKAIVVGARGARIKASLSPGWGSAKPVTINYEFGLPGSTNHERAALAFAEACNLTGTFVRLDAVLDGYMFVREGVLCKAFTIADHPYVEAGLAAVA